MDGPKTNKGKKIQQANVNKGWDIWDQNKKIH